MPKFWKYGIIKILFSIKLLFLQVSGQLPTVSITTTDTTVPPPACVPNITTAIDIEAILYQLNNGELPIQDPNNVPFPIAPLDCEKDGPIMVSQALDMA